MKHLAIYLLASACTLTAANAFAQIEVGQVSTRASQFTTAETLNNITEAGFQISSINDGSVFASLAVTHEFENGFDLGVRGLLPMEYRKQAQAYMGEVFGRFMMVNDVNQMYIETNLTQGFFNTNYGTVAFGMVGASYGYTRHIGKQFALGALIGVDYSPSQLSHDGVFNHSSTLYNHIGVSGGYYF
jgi:hypothetical protein